MQIFRAYKVEIDPNNKQRTDLLKHSGTARFAWNWALARRKREYEETGKSSNYFEQSRQLNKLKKTEFPWLYEVSKCAPQEALKNLDKAYRNFFRRVKNGEKPGFPKFKSRKKGIGSFKFSGSVCVEDSRIKLPRIGWLKIKENGYIPTANIHILSATVSEAAKRWFISVQCKQDIIDTIATGNPVGVDLGIKTMAVVSDGREFENPEALKKSQTKLARLQRELSRRKKGSKNREKTRQKIAKVHCKVTNIRRDALHKATSSIVAKNKLDDERPSAIVIENLNIAGMVKNRCLARAISDVGMGEFRSQIEYKAKWYGEKLIVADRFFPSSKTCSVCGQLNNSLTLADREWDCICGKHHNRDLNAAINLSLLAKTTASSAGSHACGQSVRLASASCFERSRN